MSQRPEPTPLRVAAAAGARWTAGSTLFSVFMQFVQVAVLARLLDPVAFGLAAAAMVIVGLAGQLGEAGLTNAIIARQERDPDVLSSLYWANVLVGIGAMALVLAAIPLGVAVFGSDDIAVLLLIAAPASVIAPFGQQFGALMSRDLRFRPLALAESASIAVGVVGAVALALLGAGAASIIGGYLVQVTSRAAMLAAIGWRRQPPRWRLRRSDLRGYVSFSMWQMGERTVNYVGSNLDYIVIGAFIGARALGIYTIAYRLVSLVHLRLNPILTKVAFPLFAKRQNDDAALRGAFVELTRLVAFVAFPIMVTFAVTADTLVPVVYGDQWTDSAPVLQALACAGIFFALSNPNGAIFLAKNRPDLGFKINALRVVLLALAFAVAIDGGIVAVAWTFAGVVAFMFAVTRVLLYRVIGLTAREYAWGLWQPAVVAVGMGAAMALVTILLDGATADAPLLLVQLATGALALAGLTALFAREWALSTYRLAVSR